MVRIIKRINMKHIRTIKDNKDEVIALVLVGLVIVWNVWVFLTSVPDALF